MLLCSVCTLYNQLRSRVAMGGKVHLILHRLKEQAGRLCAFIVIECRCVQVGDLLIEFSLGEAYLANLLQIRAQPLWPPISRQ